MSGFMGSLFHNLMGYSDTGISVPPMDSMFKPNNRLEEAPRLAATDGMDNLAASPHGLLCSGGNILYAAAPEKGNTSLRELDQLDGPITFIATNADGRIALATEEGGLRVGVPGGWARIDLPPMQARCVTAGHFRPDGTLVLCIGSTQNPASEWKRDLMMQGASGLVVTVPADGGPIGTLAERLAFPYGIAPGGDDTFAISESWRHRIVQVAANKTTTRPLLNNLPAYPSGMAVAGDGGYWLSLFAPRRQLFEMILKEDDYRMEMMANIDPSEWIGPSLRPTTDPDQPLLQGAVRQMGILKPWAPSQSYGLVIRCDRNMSPVESWHSRADGAMHGVTSVCEFNDSIYAASKGAGQLLHLDSGSLPEGEAR